MWKGEEKEKEEREKNTINLIQYHLFYKKNIATKTKNNEKREKLQKSLTTQIQKSYKTISKPNSLAHEKLIVLSWVILGMQMWSNIWKSNEEGEAHTIRWMQNTQKEKLN